MLIKIFAPGYYARQDTKTPVKIGIIAMVSNMVFNGIFAPFYGYVGLSIASVLSALLNATLLYRGLHIENIYRISRQTLFFVLRLAIAGVAMVSSLLWFSPTMEQWLSFHLLERVGWLFGLIAIGASVYLVIAMILGIRPRHLRTDS